MSDKKTEAKPRPAPRPTVTSAPFWDAAKQGKLVLQYDRKAGKYQYWPRPIGIHSGTQNLEWREASGRGKLYAWSEVYVPARGFEDVAPYVVAAVDLDEGVRMFARLVNVDPATLKGGQRLRVKWETVGEDGRMFVFEPEG
jgi:hypothetical protein